MGYKAIAIIRKMLSALKICWKLHSHKCQILKIFLGENKVNYEIIKAYAR